MMKAKVLMRKVEAVMRDRELDGEMKAALLHMLMLAENARKTKSPRRSSGKEKKS